MSAFQHRIRPGLLAVLFAANLLALVRADEVPVEVRVHPATVQLRGPRAVYSLLVEGTLPDGTVVDLTGTARYRSRDPGKSEVSDAGVLRSVSDGDTRIDVAVVGRTLQVPVRVERAQEPRVFHFENDVVPLLSRYGCNASGCHGKAEGQNGFKLSVFGFDPPADYAALVHESRGRRVFLSAPEQSLLLQKMSGGVAHGGGVRLRRGTAEYETIRAWLAAGAPYGDAAAPLVARIRLEPRERVLAMHGRQQLRVVARYTDGREVDVTAHARFQSNQEGLASVSDTGLVVAGEAPGDVAVMASYMGAVDVFRALVPRPERIADYPAVPANNFIDELVLRKLQKLQILPSELADDATFLRRVYLDILGTLPTAAEARAFLNDRRPDRRARLVDRLLARPELADYWALQWADLLRVDRQALGHKQAYAFYQWIRDSLAANKPLDRFAQDLLMAEGELNAVGPASFYKVVSKPGEAASTLSQVFLGVRIACAECHHHPFDRWSQTDYLGMQAYFTQLGVKNAPRGPVLVAAGDPQTRHPRTNAVVPAHGLGMPMTATPPGDRRVALAAWLTAPENPWFARNLANRVWAHFLGRGLVDPVDDVRLTNPPSNPELLDALARHLVDQRFDLRQLIRTITASRTYQLSAHPNATNERDELNYSRALFRRLDAEVLLDMVCQTTGVPEKFPGTPTGYRAIQLWDSKVPHYFLTLFGRPVRASACECERAHEPGVGQILHLLNAPEIHHKLAHAKGNIARWSRELADDGTLVEELYLTFYSRYPTAQERKLACDHLRRDPARRREVAEDLAWSMINSLEFVFNH